MPRQHRREKIGSVLQHEIGLLFSRDFNFEGALVTVLGVEVSGDLLSAAVKLGIIPYERGPLVFQQVMAERKSIERTLVRKLPFRPVPHLHFRIEEN